MFDWCRVQSQTSGVRRNADRRHTYYMLESRNVSHCHTYLLERSSLLLLYHHSRPYSVFKNGPIPASFFVYGRPFLITISICKNSNKLSWCAWDSNPGPHDGRRRQNHGAMAAALTSLLFRLPF